MTDLGTRLKRARETQGVDLRDIAAATKISVAALEALERNDYSRLPGGIFSRSFVRSYALAVGLDPDATVNEFVTALQHYEREAERNARKPEISADDRAFLARQQRAFRRLRLGLLAGGLVLIALVLYLWLVWWPARTAI
jgi:cytoskeletal protein RodZ